MEEDHKELQLLPAPHNTLSPSSSSHIPRWTESSMKYHRSSKLDLPYEGPSLDLQLSISVRRPFRPPSDNCVVLRPIHSDNSESCAEALKWQAAEQFRLAALEKAYAERVRELTRREMELAQSEFTRARHLWERAREEAEKAEKMKERAMRRINPTCMEVTCQACRQKFRS